MQILDNLTGPQFLIFYGILFVVLLIFTDFRGTKAVLGFLISELIVNLVGIIRLVDSLAEGHRNVLFLVLFMLTANLVFIIRLMVRLAQVTKLSGIRSGRSGSSGGRHSSGVGEAATAGFFFGSWGSDYSGSSCSSGSSDSGSSCSSGTSCSSGCGGCGGGGGGD